MRHCHCSVTLKYKVNKSHRERNNAHRTSLNEVFDRSPTATIYMSAVIFLIPLFRKQLSYVLNLDFVIKEVLKQANIATTFSFSIPNKDILIVLFRKRPNYVTNMRVRMFENIYLRIFPSRYPDVRNSAWKSLCIVLVLLLNELWLIILFFYSASGTSAVAIDNKIEQAMVSKYT